jgi:hypothetical protein
MFVQLVDFEDVVWRDASEAGLVDASYETSAE